MTKYFSVLLAVWLLSPLTALAQVGISPSASLKIISGNINPRYCKEVIRQNAGDEIFRCYTFYESLLRYALIPAGAEKLEVYSLFFDDPTPANLAISLASQEQSSQPAVSILAANAEELRQIIAANRLGKNQRERSTVLEPELTQSFQKQALPLQVKLPGFLEKQYIENIFLLDPYQTMWQTTPLDAGLTTEQPGPFQIKYSSNSIQMPLESIILPQPSGAPVALQEKSQINFMVTSSLFDQDGTSLEVSGAGIKISACEGVDTYVLYNHLTSSFVCEKGVISSYDSETTFDTAQNLPDGQSLISIN